MAEDLTEDMLVRGVQEECFQVFFIQKKTTKLDLCFGISFDFQNTGLRAAVFYNCIMLNLIIYLFFKISSLF